MAWPNAIRLSQVGAVVVTGLMCVCSAAVLANVVSPSDGAEGAATYIGLVVSVLNSVFGMLEIVALLLAVIPPTVSALGLRSRTLEDVIVRGAVDEDDDNAVPMLQLPAIAMTQPVAQAVSPHTPKPRQCTPPPHPQQVSVAAQTTKEIDDDAWAARLIAKVHGREE